MFSYSNRFEAIEVPIEGTPKNHTTWMQFKGYNISNEEYIRLRPGTPPLVARKLTWCDVIFMAAIEAIKDKTILITRYPIDSFYNQFPTKVVVSSTKDTEPMHFNGKFVAHYPKIRDKDIGTNTSNKFIDTMQICNAYLGSIGGLS